MKKGILLCCHGTRNNQGIKDTIKLLKIFKKKNKNYVVKIGYLEFGKPTIKKQLDFFFKKKFDNLLIVPAMIFSGNHVTKDIPRILINLKKNYKISPKVFVISPLLKSKKFFNIIQNNLLKNLEIKDKQNKGLIIVASNTTSSKTKNDINLLTKKIAKKNKISFYKKILITLNKENLKKNLKNLSQKYSSFIVIPLFLFRGNLLKNLISVIKDINKENKNKLFLCNHLRNYKEIYNVINNLITSKIT